MSELDHTFSFRIFFVAKDDKKNKKDVKRAKSSEDSMESVEQTPTEPQEQKPNIISELVFPRAYEVDYSKPIKSIPGEKLAVAKGDTFDNEPTHCLRVHKTEILGVPCTSIMPPGKKKWRDSTAFLNSLIAHFKLKVNPERVFPFCKPPKTNKVDEQPEPQVQEEEDKPGSQDSKKRKAQSYLRPLRVIPVYMLPFIFHAMGPEFHFLNNTSSIFSDMEQWLRITASSSKSRWRDDHYKQLVCNREWFYRSIKLDSDEWRIKAEQSMDMLTDLREMTRVLATDFIAVRTTLEDMSKEKSLMLERMNEYEDKMEDMQEKINQLEKLVPQIGTQ